MSKKLLFIINPISGKTQIKNELLEIIDLFVKNDYIVTTHSTQSTGDANRYVSEHINNFDLIVCSGGDGTLNEVVSAVTSTGANIKIGYIPTGTTNDFASSIGISKNITEASRRIIEGNDFSCDVGLFNNTNFLYVAAFGIFTNVPYTTPQEAKNIFGHLAYILESAKCLTDIKSYSLKVLCDGKSVEDEFLFGMISNSNSIGGFKNLASQKVELNDGLFEVLLVKMPSNLAEFRLLIRDLLSHELESDFFYRFMTSSIDIFSEEKMPWTIDGEFGGDLNLVSIKNLKEAVTFIV